MLDPRTHHPTNSFRLHPTTNSYYDTWESTNSGLWPSKPPEFPTESKDVDESGISSPPLWTTSPPRSPQHRRNNHYRSLSPTSRTQAIVRGQRELMEMVRNMPESNYELSLKDLVEHQRVEARQEKKVEERSLMRESGGGGSGSGSGRNKMAAHVKRRSGGGKVDGGGFYLKMVFPFTLRSKDKNKNKNKMMMNKTNSKKKESLANGGSKVSPRPSGSDGSGKGVDKEWWKKSPSALRESDSGTSSSSINSGSMKSSGSSSSNSSTSRSNSRHEKSRGGCWPLIRRLKKA